jgi:hypothetical protein
MPSLWATRRKTEESQRFFFLGIWECGRWREGEGERELGGIWRKKVERCPRVFFSGWKENCPEEFDSFFFFTDNDFQEISGTALVPRTLLSPVGILKQPVSLSPQPRRVIPQSLTPQAFSIYLPKFGVSKGGKREKKIPEDDPKEVRRVASGLGSAGSGVPVDPSASLEDNLHHLVKKLHLTPDIPTLEEDEWVHFWSLYLAKRRAREALEARRKREEGGGYPEDDDLLFEFNIEHPSHGLPPSSSERPETKSHPSSLLRNHKLRCCEILSPSFVVDRDGAVSHVLTRDSRGGGERGEGNVRVLFFSALPPSLLSSFPPSLPLPPSLLPSQAALIFFKKIIFLSKSTFDGSQITNAAHFSLKHRSTGQKNSQQRQSGVYEWTEKNSWPATSIGILSSRANYFALSKENLVNTTRVFRGFFRELF